MPKIMTRYISRAILLDLLLLSICQPEKRVVNKSTGEFPSEKDYSPKITVIEQ
jgi:hypothetical protein